MAHPAYLRKKARSLRGERRLTIDELAERLALPRGTIYSWVREIPIARTSRQSAAQRVGTLAMKAKYRKRREEAYRWGRQEFAKLAGDPSFRDFVCLYIAEGYKRSRNTVSLCNSDPAVMALATRWMSHFSARPLKASVQYHADQDPETAYRPGRGAAATV